jgi:hypothetical protein
MPPFDLRRRLVAEGFAIARSLTNTFSGIRPQDVPGFMAAELTGAVAALLFMNWLLQPTDRATSIPNEISR